MEMIRMNVYGLDAVGHFSEGLAPALKNDFWFHVGLDYKPAYEARYDDVGDYHQGLAAATLNGYEFHITRDGKPAYEARYRWVGNFADGSTTAVLDDGSLVTIGLDGKPIT